MSKKKKQKKNLSKKTTGVVSEKLNFTDTESDLLYGDNTDNLSKHLNFMMTWRPLIR